METTTTSVVPPLPTQSILIALLLSIIALVAAVSNRMRMSPMNAATRVTHPVHDGEETSALRHVGEPDCTIVELSLEG
eukprot:3037867-Amphidinium_carterae.1